MNKMVDGSGVEAATVGVARGWCSLCPLGHWPTHKSELDGSLCALHCIICPLSSLRTMCNQFEIPCNIETDSKDEIREMFSPW